MSVEVPESYTALQAEAVAFWQGYNVPADWFFGLPDDTGQVEVIAIGRDIRKGDEREDDTTFIWSVRIEHDGRSYTSEATVTAWETGISV